MQLKILQTHIFEHLCCFYWNVKKKIKYKNTKY